MDKTEVQPHEGWSEQDPYEIMHHIKLCAENAIDQLTELGEDKTCKPYIFWLTLFFLMVTSGMNNENLH